MKNTYIPLDIIFIKKNGKIDSINFNTKPLDTKRIKSKNKIVAVLEINAGEAKQFNFDINSNNIISSFLERLIMTSWIWFTKIKFSISLILSTI